MARIAEIAQKAADPTAAELSDQIAALKADIAGLAATLAAMGKAKGQAVADAAREDVAALRAKGEETAATLAQEAKDLAAEAESLLRNRPATALGIAVGLGFLVGLMTNRR